MENKIQENADNIKLTMKFVKELAKDLMNLKIEQIKQNEILKESIKEVAKAMPKNKE